MRSRIERTERAFNTSHTQAAAEMISIVDDDVAVREMLVSLTRSLGYDALGFESAEEFLASADFEKFTCAITDIHMPGMNGFELQERLQQLNDSFPVIMITALSEPDLERKAISGGAIGLLRKPVDVGMLVGYIEKALRD
jgi:FixJ family two-component response regulator